MSRYGQENKRPQEDYEPVEVEDCHAIKESESGKALLISFHATKGLAKSEWVPKVAIHDDSEVYEPGHHGKLVVWRFIAEEKGMV